MTVTQKTLFTFLILILTTLPISKAIAQKDLAEYHVACIVMVYEFANENPRSKDDATALTVAYDLQKMEECMLDLSSMFKKAQRVARKASRLVNQ